MHQNIGDLIGNFVPFCIFLYFALVVSGVIKTDSVPDKFRNPNMFTKFVVYGGSITFAALIVMRLFMR
jgi:hypothetical protein